MPDQEPEPPFSATERLFRWLLADWVINGQPTSAAVALPVFSVDREAVSPLPETALGLGPPEATAVAALVFGEMPARFVYAGGTSTYESAVVHCPENGNNAHAEIRLRRPGETEYVMNIGNKKFRSQIKDELAELMRIVFTRGAAP